MQADTSKMGECFYKLVQARNSSLREDIVNYDGEDTYLLDCYVLATDDSGYENVYSTELGAVEIVRVGTVTVYGSAYETRCYGRTTLAYKDAAGNLWMDEQLHDEVFC